MQLRADKLPAATNFYCGARIQYRTEDTCLQVSLRQTLLSFIADSDSIGMTVFLRFCLRRTKQNSVRNRETLVSLCGLGVHC